MHQSCYILDKFIFALDVYRNFSLIYYMLFVDSLMGIHMYVIDGDQIVKHPPMILTWKK